MIDEETFWGFNDSGGKPGIYQLSATNPSTIVKTVTLKGKNTDFESIAEDEDNIYVGDIGNNYGNRKDISIHFFSKNLLRRPPISQLK